MTGARKCGIEKWAEREGGKKKGAVKEIVRVGEREGHGTETVGADRFLGRTLLRAAAVIGCDRRGQNRRHAATLWGDRSKQREISGSQIQDGGGSRAT